MRIFLILLTALFLPVSPALAGTYTFFVGWSIDTSTGPTIGGYRIYDDNHTLRCQTQDGSATSMTCTVDTDQPRMTFTLVSVSTDNIESDPSDPFTIIFTSSDPLKADFIATTPPGTLTASFDGSASTGTITAYQWDFGDGATAQTTTASHTFPSSATYTVTLTVTDTNNNTDTTSKQVTVDSNSTNQSPTADISVSPVMGDAPLTVTLDGSGSSDPENEQLTYTWTLGDGSTSSGSATISHQYPTPGTYTPQLTVTDPHAASDTISSQPIQVNTPDTNTTTTPTAVIGASRLSGKPPVTVSFSGTGSTPSSQSATITAYSWTFGDGAAAGGPVVQHTYTTPGTYTVRLTVTDSTGKQATASMTFTATSATTRNNAGSLIPIYKLLLLK